jgi:hypothetical protein
MPSFKESYNTAEGSYIGDQVSHEELNMENKSNEKMHVTAPVTSAEGKQVRYALKRGRLPQPKKITGEAENVAVPTDIVDVEHDAIGVRVEKGPSGRIKKSTEVVGENEAKPMFRDGPKQGEKRNVGNQRKPQSAANRGSHAPKQAVPVRHHEESLPSRSRSSNKNKLKGVLEKFLNFFRKNFKKQSSSGKNEKVFSAATQSRRSSPRKKNR